MTQPVAVASVGTGHSEIDTLIQAAIEPARECMQRAAAAAPSEALAHLYFARAAVDAAIGTILRLRSP